VTTGQIDRVSWLGLRWAFIIAALALGAIGWRAGAVGWLIGLAVGVALGVRREVRRRRRWS